MSTYRDLLHEEMRLNSDSRVELETQKIEPWFLGEQNLEPQQVVFLATHWLDGDDLYWELLDDYDRTDFKARGYSDNYIYILFNHPDCGRYCLSEPRAPSGSSEIIMRQEDD